MKSILIIDTPNNCSECQFCGWGGRNLEKYVCSLTREHSEEPHLVGCPLKPLPKKLYVEASQIEDVMHTEMSIDNLTAKIILDTDKLFALGWNACLEKITGETE